MMTEGGEISPIKKGNFVFEDLDDDDDDINIGKVVTNNTNLGNEKSSFNMKLDKMKMQPNENDVTNDKPSILKQRTRHRTMLKNQQKTQLHQENT